MTLERLKDLLERHHVKYQTIRHPPAFTAQETAQSAHVRTREFAKTVVVQLDGRLAMAVLPAARKLDLGLLEEAAGAKHARLAAEPEFESRFPGCAVGAMPPFGNLYDMDVYVDKTLAERGRIAFNAGSHRELLKMDYRDFDRLVRPSVVTLSHDPGPFEAAGRPLALTAAAVEILDVFAQGGQAACSSTELRRSVHRPAREIDEGVDELERHELLRTGYATAEECGYELTPAGREYVSHRLHMCAL